MADETTQVPNAGSEFVDWFSGWLRANKPEEVRGSGVMWVVNEAIDPLTGDRPLVRAMVGKWINPAWKPERHLEPASYRTLAAFTNTRRDFVTELVARDIQCADPTPRESWPHFVHPAAAKLSSRRRQMVREVVEAACAAEGLID